MDKSTFNTIKESTNIAAHVIDNYWNMTKEELRDIISEVFWVATRHLSDEDTSAFNKEVLDSLEENRVEEDE